MMKPLLFVALLLAACSKGSDKAGGGPPAKRAPKVTVALVERSPVTYEVEIVGTLEAQEQVAVAAGVAGVVSHVSFREGDKVTKETVLCKVDETRYALEADRARADKARAEADAVHAESAYNRRVKLHEQKMISDDELTEYKAQFDRAVAEVARLQATLALAEKALSDSSVRPPIAGIINSKSVSTGEYAKAETVVATISDVSTLHVRFAVPETESSRVRPGQAVTFTARVLGMKSQPAEIFWVSQTADPRTRTVECKARVANPDSALKPGFSGVVKVALAEEKQAIVVEAEAVLPTEDGFVAFILDQGKARRKKLSLGVHTRGDRIEILDGLNEGETLIIRGAAAIRDGQEVDVVK